MFTEDIFRFTHNIIIKNIEFLLIRNLYIYINFLLYYLIVLSKLEKHKI